jgi:two-component system chemotaxis sensor kinase CheA
VKAVDALFRHAHSVKGMAASMGYEPTAGLGHRLEDLLAIFRDAPDRLEHIDVDLCLAAVDALTGHVQSASKATPFPDNADLQVRFQDRLTMLTGKVPEPAPSPAPEVPPPAASPEPLPRTSAVPRLLVKVRISPQCATPGVRGFLVYKRLSTLGQVFELKPPLEEVKAGKLVDGVITLELETPENEAKVFATLKTIADVEALAVRPAGDAVAPEPEAPRAVGQEPARTVRVRTELLDQFLDAAGELLLATARVREVGKGLPPAVRPPLDESVDRLHALVRELHDKVMKARMTPLSVVTDRLPRATRDIARRRNREVELKLSGTEIELDRAIVDELADPLLHLLRNAIDHGIETPEERASARKPPKGSVSLTVRRAKDRVVLEVEDDGRGMDGAKLRAAAVERGLYTAEEAARLSPQAALMLCCLPGVSTAADVTDISGRGVGMDAVKRAVETAGGTLEIESTVGRGTRIRLHLPLTVAVVNLLLVGVGNEILGLPIAKVLGVVEERPSKLSFSQHQRLLPFANGMVPVYPLSQLLELPRAGLAEDAPRPFVVVEGDDGRIALEVERLHGQEEVVLKALAKPLDLVAGLSGVTILGNGRPVFILDVTRLVGHA